MIKKLFLSVLFMMNFSQGFANEPSSTQRIHSLLPEGIKLNIEPYIPNDFVLVKPEKNLGMEEFFWMPDGLYEKYMADTNSVHRPFIHVMFPGDFIVPGDLKNKDRSPMKEYVAGMKENFPVRVSSLQWGNHEVIAIKMNATDDDEYMAFVDLNRDGGGFIIFRLGYYKKLDHGNGNKPSKEDLAFWDDFLRKTKGLN